MLVTSIFPPEAGGPATFISALAPALAEAGHQVRVFTLWDREPPQRPAWLFGAARSRSLPLRMLTVFGRLLRHVGWADLVYVNGLELPAVLAARLKKRPCLLKIVGDYAWERARLRGGTSLSVEEFQEAPLPLGLGLQRWLRGFYASRADLIITPSRYLEKIVSGWRVPRNRIKVVFNGLTPIPPPLSELCWTPRPASQEPLILAAARLVNWKGIDHLIEALKLLERPARLLILGQGPERARLTRLADELGLSRRVDFGGRVARGEVLHEMSRADAFVLPSGYEGLPHVILEALFVGVPVVAARAGGTPEVITDQETGLLVPFGRPDLLAAALDRIFSDPSLAVFLSRAGRAAAVRFAWSETVAQSQALIEGMIR